MVAHLRLAAVPVIAVPTIAPEGDTSDAPHPAEAAYRAKLSGKYAYRVITGRVAHNLPQEAPRAFAQAVIDVDAQDLLPLGRGDGMMVAGAMTGG